MKNTKVKYYIGGLAALLVLVAFLLISNREESEQASVNSSENDSIESGETVKDDSQKNSNKNNNNDPSNSKEGQNQNDNTSEKSDDTKGNSISDKSSEDIEENIKVHEGAKIIMEKSKKDSVLMNVETGSAEFFGTNLFTIKGSVASEVKELEITFGNETTKVEVLEDQSFIFERAYSEKFENATLQAIGVNGEKLEEAKLEYKY